MAKTKHTKNELKKEKNNLRRYERYLPTLAIKKKQLQAEIIKALHSAEELETTIKNFTQSVYKWADVFSEEANIGGYIKVSKVHTAPLNVAGIDVPVFQRLDIEEKPYDYISTPLWVDFGIEAVKRLCVLKAQAQVIARQVELLREELRITTQRVNLFEKVKIPEAKDNIRRIRIFLGDLGTAAVVTGKTAKRKLEEKKKEVIRL